MATLVTAAVGAAAGGGTVGTIISAIGTVVSGLSARGAAKQQAAIAQRNAQVAQNNAEAARQAAEQDAKEIRQETRRRMGAQRARAAAGGVVTTEGSPLLAILEQSTEGAFAAQKRISQGSRQATGFLDQSASDTAQASAFKSRGNQSLFQSGIRASTGLLTGTNLLGS